MITIHALPAIILLAASFGMIITMIIMIRINKKVERLKDDIIKKQGEIIANQEPVIKNANEIICKQKELIEHYRNETNPNAPMRVFIDNEEVYDFMWDKNNNSVIFCNK